MGSPSPRRNGGPAPRPTGMSEERPRTRSSSRKRRRRRPRQEADPSAGGGRRGGTGHRGSGGASPVLTRPERRCEPHPTQEPDLDRDHDTEREEERPFEKRCGRPREVDDDGRERPAALTIERDVGQHEPGEKYAQGRTGRQ